MLLVIGVLLVLVGGLLLLWTFGYLQNFSALWPMVFVVLGLLLLYFVFVRRVPEVYAFPGMLMGVGGLYFLLGTSFMSWQSLFRIWPIFMAIAGISILPYAMMKRGSARAALLVPGVAIIVLAAVFLLFSLHLISQRLSHVAYMWWPLLIVILGIVFLASHVKRKQRISEGGADESSERFGAEE
jgi:peptidoglycan/LPS O-acetylase OafA/YrhL